MLIMQKMIITISLLLLSSSSFATTTVISINEFCTKLDAKLHTVTLDGCNAFELQTLTKNSTLGNPLTHREVLPSADIHPKGKILFIAGVHGDEFASVSLTYLWLKELLGEKDTYFHWLFLPVVNPDGLFKSPATRTNANLVDLNRNLPSPDWEEKALSEWKNRFHSNKRRYPGPYANSEIENQWLVYIIERFEPDAIISIHAPYGMLDYDGPAHAIPRQIGSLKYRPLGTFPGSLGRYAGEYLNIPVLTLELGSAGSMPSLKEIKLMRYDLENWLETKIKEAL